MLVSVGRIYARIILAHFTMHASFCMGNCTVWVDITDCTWPQSLGIT